MKDFPIKFDDFAIYAAGKNDAREFERALGISLLGVTPEGVATFAPDSRASFDAAWDLWVSDLFQARLAPVFIEVYGAAAEMKIREIIASDQQLDADLSPSVKERSIAAGEPFREGKTKIQSMPQWERFEESLVKEEAPGHLVTLFALQSSLFHLPLVPALVSYVYFEWRSALKSLSSEKQEVSTEGFLKALPVIRQLAAPAGPEGGFAPLKSV